ncbi:uncharacterized protein EV154DRAFT_482158 [Mucor mucedo]|uniref:uncharacterized protein n=1 Tax=Mucor mucedo TaxID=29922 RepID=UPI00221E98AA|nr:uncharacterized protein EV154DRAFT_482158 [Mucor mucedo]KAI7890435.1 hypothetical protein EV154DRAFT_482158 [Mucor mucedo]
MRLTDIPVFFIAAPKTGPTLAIAVSSVTPPNTTTADTAPLIGDRHKSCMVYEILQGGCMTTVPYRRQTSFCMATLRRISHYMIMWLLSCIKTLLFLLQKAICYDKVRHHDEHLADEEKYKTYCDIRIILLECEFRSPIGDLVLKIVVKKIYTLPEPIRPIYISVKYFHSGNTLGQNSHLYSTRFFKEKKSKYIDKCGNSRVLFDLNHETTISCISTFVHYASKNEKKVVSNIAVIVTIVRLLKMVKHSSNVKKVTYQDSTSCVIISI